MSVFGPKKKNVQENQIDKEQLKELTEQLCGRIVKKVNEKLTEQINDLLTRQLTTVKAEQQNLFNSYSTLNTEINKVSTEFDKVKNKRIITIWAERAGPLRSDEMLSFGNGGREEEVGYTMMYNGRILKMGMSTHPTGLDPGSNIIASVSITVNGQKLSFVYLEKIQLYRIANYDSRIGQGWVKKFDTPLEVSAGDIIGFQVNNFTDNNNATNTIVSAMIEIDLDT